MRTTSRFLAAAFIAVLAGREARAQEQDGTVRGLVLSAPDQRAIQAALVRVEGTHIQDLTHADGSFLLTHVPAGPQRVIISAIGYRPHVAAITIAPGDTVRITARLEESILQLEELVTTGTLGRRSLQETLSPTSAIGGASLDRQLGGTVAATLRNEPGVASGGIGPATAQPVIRGLGGDRVVLLEDGVRPGDLAATSADHAVTIDPLTAQSVEVVRGPMSLLYGSSALGGVVNVVRQEIPVFRPDDIHGTVTGQANSVNRGGALGGYLTAGVGPFALRAEGSVRGAGDTRTPLGRMVNTQTSGFELAGAGSYVGHGGHAGVSYRWFDSQYGIPGGFVGGHEAGVDISMTRHTVRLAGELHRETGRWESLEASAGFTGYRHTEFEPSGEEGTRFRQMFVTASVRARHRGFLGAGSGAVGLDARHRDIETGGSLRTPSTRDYAVAGFVVQEYGRGPFRFQAGLRYDLTRYEPTEGGTIFIGGEQVPIRPRTFGSLSGSVAGLIEIAENVRLGASIARAYRTPDFIELYSDGPHLADNSYTVGDPSLAAESGLGFDVFARIDRSRIRAELAVFRNVLSDYVFPSSRGRALIGRQGGRPLFQYTNESARFTGGEARVAVTLTPRIVLEGSGSYVAAVFTSQRAPIPIIEPPDTTFVEASKYPPFIPPLFGTLDLRYERPSHFFGGGIRWATAQTRLGDFESRTDGYLIGDLHAGLRLLIGGRYHTVTLKVENLADTEYRDHLSRIKGILPQPGRNVSLLYRLSF